MIADTQTLTPPVQALNSPELVPGTVVDGAFRVVRLLGKGGMGSVYHVEEIALKRKCALKVIALPPGADADGCLAGRLMREAQLMAGIRHPGVVSVMRYGVDGTTGLPYYTMPDHILSPARIAHVCRTFFHCEPPLLPGSDDAHSRPLTLAGILDGCRALPESVVARIGLELLEALQALHNRRPPIIHRDIKPSNLLVDADGHILLSDFGVAKLATPVAGDQTLTLTGVTPGTPQFSSPEQRAGQNDELTCASDYYSFGLVLFRALTGGMPSPDFPELPEQAKQMLVPPWNALFRGLLAQDPSLRLSDPGLVGNQLREIERTVALRKRTKNKTGRFVRFALPAVAIVLFAAGGAIGYHLFLKEKSKSERSTVWIGEPPAPAVSGLEGRVAISNSGIVVTVPEREPEEAAAIVSATQTREESSVPVSNYAAPLYEPPPAVVETEAVAVGEVPAIVAALRSIDSSIEVFGRMVGKTRSLPAPVRNEKGEDVFTISAGEAVSVLDCDFPPNARIHLDGGTLVFAPGESDLKKYLEALHGYRRAVQSRTISPATAEPDVPLAADQDIDVRVPIEIGPRGGVFEDVFEMNRIHLRAPVTAHKDAALPLLKINSGLVHFTFASLPTGLRIDGSYSVPESVQAGPNGRTVRRTRHYGDNYPGEITVH